MTPAGAWESVAASAVDLIWRTSWQAGLLAGALAVGVLFWKSIPAGARLLLWWLVCLKFIVGLAWTQPIAVPVLDGRAQAGAVLPFESGSRLPSEGESSARSATLLERWPSILMAVWLGGLAWQLRQTARDWQRTRALVAGARPADEALQLQSDALCERLGLRRSPGLRISCAIDSPLVTGLSRPTIVLPESASSWSAEERSMALTHELLHVKRRDLWHGLVPALAARLFFFHPMARLAAREYVLAREAGCDAQTVAILGAKADAYADMLVRFGVTHRSVPAIGGASTTFHMLKRRLVMLQDPENHTRGLSWRWGALAALIAVVAIPFQLTARRAEQRGAPARALEQVERREPVERARAVEVLADAPQDRRDAERESLEAQRRAVEQQLHDVAVSASRARESEQQLHDVQTDAARRAQIAEFVIEQRDTLRQTVEQLRAQSDAANALDRQKVEEATRKLLDEQESAQVAAAIAARRRNLEESAQRMLEVAEAARQQKLDEERRLKVEQDLRLKLRDQQSAFSTDAELRQRLEVLKARLDQLAAEIARIQEQIK